MTPYRIQGFTGLISIAALVATTLVAAVPATAATQEPAAAKKDIRSLDRHARQMVWCVERKVADGAKKMKQCKTREAWIREGNDPLREY
jgi:hypothetical protein